MTPRRKRYSVEVSKPPYYYNRETQEVLCYDAISGKKWLEDHGYVVHNIQLTKDVIKIQEGIGWKVTAAGLARAKSEFNLVLPVVVKQNSRVGNGRGTYRLRTNKNNHSLYHSIIVKNYLTPQQATETLWHEFAHAAQAERAMIKANNWDAKVWSAESKYQRNFPYTKRPIEKEANAKMKALAHVPLAIKAPLR